MLRLPSTGSSAKPAGDREVGARAARARPMWTCLPASTQHRPVERQARLELGAAQRHQRVLLELEVGAEHRDLERRLVGVVADQRVGERERHRVHRAAGTQAEVLVAVPAAVLHRREHARAQDAHASLAEPFELGARDGAEAHAIARGEAGSAARGARRTRRAACGR